MYYCLLGSGALYVTVPVGLSVGQSVDLLAVRFRAAYLKIYYAIKFSDIIRVG